SGSTQSRSALMAAAASGRLNVVNELLNHGANANAKDEDCIGEYYGRTALHYAARNGRLDIIQRLIEANANLNIADSLGYTALKDACEGSSIPVIEFLLRAGAQASPKVKKRPATTPLIVAATSQNFELVQLLLKADALVNEQDKTGFTALMRA